MKNRTGEIRKNNYGLMEIVEYNGWSDIKVKFKTGSIVKTQYNNFKNGYVKDPLFPIVYGTGYLGIGKYKSTINGKNTIEYKTWCSMIQRCYDPYLINKYLTYQDVIVCKEWLNFQTFAEWFNNNYYEIFDEKVELDKDIIKRGNKIYSPEYCSFVPQSINLLLTKRDKFRGKYPVGVCFEKSSNKYIARTNINGKRKYLGLFRTPEKAFEIYKKAKVKYIKRMAEEYKEVLNTKTYNSLIKYKPEITD